MSRTWDDLRSTLTSIGIRYREGKAQFYTLDAAMTVLTAAIAQLECVGDSRPIQARSEPARRITDLRAEVDWLWSRREFISLDEYRELLERTIASALVLVQSFERYGYGAQESEAPAANGTSTAPRVVAETRVLREVVESVSQLHATSVELLRRSG